MPVGIDLSPYALRITTRDDDRVNSLTQYGVQGIPPKWNEPIVWNDPSTTRYTLGDQPISLMEVWWLFSQNHRAAISYKGGPEGGSITANAAELLSEALAVHVPRHSEEFVVLAVDNLLPEFQQTTLLRWMGAKGFNTRRELLWRPIALALAHLSTLDNIPYEEGDRIVIVDTDAYIPEITVLTMKEHCGHLVSLRDYPKTKRKQENQPFSGYSVFNLLRQILASEIFEDETITSQLHAGSAASAFLQYLDSGVEDEIWVRKELDHQRLTVSDDWFRFLSGADVSGESFHDFKTKVDQTVDETGAVQVLWNGMISRLHKDEISENIVLTADAISLGASEYGRRRIEGKPGYLDTLPGIRILSRDVKKDSYDFYDVILGGEVEGGEIVRIPNPLTHFKLEKSVKEFTAVLQNVAEDTYKRYDTGLPELENDDHIPLVLKAVAQPGQGHARVTIEGADGFEDVFGENRQIELDWERGIDFELPTYSGPEPYPVQGRIVDDEHCRAAARRVVREKLTLGDKIDFPCGTVSFARIHEPWGYEDPCGNYLGESTRALFGAKEENDHEIDELAAGISDQIYATVKGTSIRQKYLNYMFRYAPERFREELRHLYSIKNPDLTWNTIYAVGRTFYKAKDYELFLDFLIRKSVSKGYPDYPNADSIPAYFWSFFRCLCFYKETVDVPREKIETVLSILYQYSEHCHKTHWPGGRKANVIKYILSGILYSLRMRKKYKDFIKPESDLFENMIDAIDTYLPRIDYPKTMFAKPRSDKLNDYVKRFLLEKQTAEDLSVLRGLVIDM